MATDQIDLETASELFATEVNVKYQNKMRLAGTIEERHGTSGTTLNVPVSDLVEMEEGNFAPTDIPITDIDETNRAVVTRDYHLKTAIGGGQKTLFNYDKIVTHAKLHGLAGGRLDDFIKIDAIFSDPDYASIFQIDVGVGVNSGINSQKMAAGLAYLEDQGVEVNDNQVVMYIPALVKQAMIDDERIVNIFYNDNKPLVSNRIKKYEDVDCRFLGSNGINKIPGVTVDGVTTYAVPMLAKETVVQTYNRDFKSEIVWVPQNDRWEIISVMTSGAKVIQLNGIVLLVAENPFVENA